MELQDWVDAVLAFLKVFAWPGVVVTLGLVYRKPLIGVLQRLHKAAGFGASVELAQSFEQSARALSEANIPDLETGATETRETEPESERDPELGPEPEPSDTWVPVAESPAQDFETFKHYWAPAAIRAFWESNSEAAAKLGVSYPEGNRDAERYGRMMLAWVHLEVKAVRLGELMGLSASSARNLGVLSAKLLDGNRISHEGAEIMRSLQRLRNDLVHEVENINISPSFTNDFVATADKLTRLFEQLIQELEEEAKG